MTFDLVDRRHHCCPVEERREVLDHEVTDPDGADLVVGEQRLERAVGLQGPLEGRGQCLVQDQQVDLVDSEFVGAFLEAVPRLVVSVVPARPSSSWPGWWRL
jgi:hypothetical protein